MIPLSVLILLTIKLCSSARILGIVPTPSYSHQIIFQPIFKELAKRGHELVVLTTDPQKDTNLTNLKQIDWSYSYKIWRRDLNEVIASNPFTFITSLFEVMHKITIYQLEHPEVAALINNKTEQFDLVMIEYLFPTMYAFKHRFNCPFIGMTSLETPMPGQLAVGNAVHQVLYPEAIIPFGDNLSFIERLISFIISHFFNQYTKYYMREENDVIEKYFGEGYPELLDIGNSVDMMFMNVNPVFGNVRPVTPASVIISGGIHIKEPKPLPKDLKAYLDSAKTGVIYFSLGSNVKSIDIPLSTRENILKVFSDIPYKVLWKFEAEELPNKPNNVKIQKWISQQDVLRHPNIKLFITQGGLQSLEEALFSHVPLVVMPFFADQDFNANKIVSEGLGVSVDYNTMSVDEFKKALLEVINNPKYKNKAKELANRVKDEPMNALEKAVWWTEYVIRNKGAQHLKGPGLNLPLYQFYYLDLIGFTFIMLLMILSVLYFLIMKVLPKMVQFMNGKKLKIN